MPKLGTSGPDLSRRRIAVVALASTLATANALGGQAPIDTLALRAHTFFLSHDLLRGRSTGSPEAEIAAVYLAGQCRSLGLQPLGAGYLHPVPLVRVTADSETRLTLRAGGDAVEFSYPDDFTLDLGTASAFRDFAGTGVYLGPADELLDGRLDVVDVSGRVAVVLGLLSGVEPFEALERLGAEAVMQLVPDDGGYRHYVQSRGPTRLAHADAGVESSFLPNLPAVVVGPRVIYAVVADNPAVRTSPRSPVPLASGIALALSADRRDVSASNVGCVLAGSDPATRDTAIVLTAHYDHLGIGPPDAAGDSIYNGFSDNAAGVAMLLTIARSFAADVDAPFRHSLVLLFLTGEERGLLGSDYFVARPEWPLGRIRGVINLDAGAPPAPPASWRIAGVADSGDVGEVAVRIGRARGWRVTTSPPKANSDYFPFVRAGVPGLFIIPGPDPYDGVSRDSSVALRARWDRYHQASDHWNADFPFAGLERYATYAALVARELDRGGDG